MKFSDIQRFTRSATYHVDIDWKYLPGYIVRSVLDYGLDINPPFQRAHVWTREQQIQYVEFRLRGGSTGIDIHTNCPAWHDGNLGREYPNGWYVLVDGKQRLEAAIAFINNELPIFGGNYYRDFEDRLPIWQARFHWHVNDLKTYEETLQWYIDLNRGGVVHTEDEIDRVREILKTEQKYVKPSDEVILTQSRLDREIFQPEIQDRDREIARRNAPTPPAPPKAKKGRRSSV